MGGWKTSMDGLLDDSINGRLESFVNGRSVGSTDGRSVALFVTFAAVVVCHSSFDVKGCCVDVLMFFLLTT